MLNKLEIQNYAIIDKLDIEFASGLTIITGETGAGKSILLGALGLIMGKRADTKVMFNQDKKCFVEAVFDISAYGLQAFFAEEDLEYFDELVIRREIAPGGKSRAFVNDSPVTLDIIQSLTENLIDVHQQFDTLDIQKPSFQLQVIDALAGNKTTLEAYTTAYKSYRTTSKKLDDLVAKNNNAQNEIAFLTFQMDEFTQADLKSGEQDDLEQKLQKLTAAEDVKKNTALLVQGIEDDENAIIGQLQSIINQFVTIKSLDPAYSDIYNRLQSTREELSDLAKEAARIYDNTEYDLEAIEATTNRLNIINRLQKKHQVMNMEDLLKKQNEIQTALLGYGDLSQEIAMLENELASQTQHLQSLAIQLRQARKNVISKLEEDTHLQLESLSMKHAYIKVRLEPLDKLAPNGMDEVNILFSPNKGSEYLPLKDTASGGELSRLTLVIKSLVAGAITLPTLVFDEIDAGVSGDVAQKMGSILTGLSQKHQVITITHSPQIAAKAHSHYWVYKTDTDHRTVTSMRKLNDEDRVIEIAKMLSGNPPSESAKANARELMGA